jgi:hypothetical protein
VDANEFWCRAFLAAMGGSYAEHGTWENHGAPAAYCEKAADAALAVAQRRGMVTGGTMSEVASEAARLSALGHDEAVAVGNARACATYAGSQPEKRRALLIECAGWALAGIAAMEKSAPRQDPELERIEFTAERCSGGGWVLISAACLGGMTVSPGDDVVNLDDGRVMRIKWNESLPPKPIEVWIERSAR